MRRLPQIVKRTWKRRRRGEGMRTPAASGSARKGLSEEINQDVCLKRTTSPDGLRENVPGWRMTSAKGRSRGKPGASRNRKKTGKKGRTGSEEAGEVDGEPGGDALWGHDETFRLYFRHSGKPPESFKRGSDTD